MRSYVPLRLRPRHWNQSWRGQRTYGTWNTREIQNTNYKNIPTLTSPVDTLLSTSDSYTLHYTERDAVNSWSRLDGETPDSNSSDCSREIKTLPQSPSSSSCDGPVADGEKTRQDETQSQSSAEGNQNPRPEAGAINHCQNRHVHILFQFYSYYLPVFSYLYVCV